MSISVYLVPEDDAEALSLADKLSGETDGQFVTVKVAG